MPELSESVETELTLQEAMELIAAYVVQASSGVEIKPEQEEELERAVNDLIQALPRPYRKLIEAQLTEGQQSLPNQIAPMT